MKNNYLQGIMLAAVLSAAASPVLAQRGHDRGGDGNRGRGQENREQRSFTPGQSSGDRQRDFSPRQQAQRPQEVQRNNDRQQRQQAQRPQQMQQQNENRQREWQQRQQAENTQRSQEMQRQNGNGQRGWQQRQQTENTQRNNESRQREWQQRQQAQNLPRENAARQRDWQQRQGGTNRSFDNKRFEARQQRLDAFKQPRNRVYAYNYRPKYSRPPVIWQGRRYYSFHNYTYHPYRPYYYGSFFHPVGFIRASLGALSVNITFGGQPYWYDQGIFYSPYNNAYRVVTPPAGIYINQLPMGYNTIELGGNEYYYFAGTFYASGPQGYYVITAPPGAIVYDLPEGCSEISVGDETYLQYNNTVFQPIEIDGRNAYEVVELDDDNDQ